MLRGFSGSWVFFAWVLMCWVFLDVWFVVRVGCLVRVLSFGVVLGVVCGVFWLVLYIIEGYCFGG